VFNRRWDVLLAWWQRYNWTGGECVGWCGEAGWADRRGSAGGHPVSAPVAACCGDGDVWGEGVRGEADSQGP